MFLSPVSIQYLSEHALTWLALIIENNSTTETSKTTIDLGTTSSSTGSSASSTSLAAFVYLATLSDGTVETITQSSSSYATTFADGQVSTISAGSSSSSGSWRSSSSGATSTTYSTQSASSSSQAQSTITSTAAYGGGAAGATTAGSTASSSTSSAASSSSNNNNNPPAGTIAGGVVGGAAGIALILLVALVALRWWRRRGQLGHQALPANTGVSPDQDQPEVSRGPGMAERAGLAPVIGAVPAVFRHQNRSRDAPSEPEPAERGFTRVSGRKLPSSFSPGMTSSSPPPTMPLTDPYRNLSSTSFYRDSAGFYGGEGAGAEGAAAGGAAGASHEGMTLSPGPQRRPTVHTGGPYTMSPTVSSPRSPSDTAGTSATFDRSDTPSSLNPDRGSRFSEAV
jgi:hypothetical protein